MAGAHYPGPGGIVTSSQSRRNSNATDDISPISKCGSLRMATWNIQGGINEAVEFDWVIGDLVQRKVDIACLQETHNCTGTNVHRDTGKVMCLENPPDTPAHQCYGLGFFIGSSLISNYLDHKVVSNRIAVLRLKFNNSRVQNHLKRKFSIITIVNVYAPTTEFGQKNEGAIPHFYDQLKGVVEDAEKNSIAVYIGGDFNSKLGIRGKNDDDSLESFMGNFGKGKRNHNGDCLADFLKFHKYYASNTRFRHSFRHRTTWHSNNLVTKTDGISKFVKNQIDYILVKECFVNAIVAARTYHGHQFSSDHGIVITDISIRSLFKLRSKYSNKSRSIRLEVNHINFNVNTTWPRNCEPISINLKKRNLDMLTRNPTVREEYKNKISTGFINNPIELSDYENFKKNIVSSAEILELKKDVNKKANYLEDHKIAQWSLDQRAIRLNLINLTDITRRKTTVLKKERNKIRNKISRRIRVLQEESARALALELEATSNTRRKFEINRLFKKSSFKSFELKDEKGYSTQASSTLIQMMKEYYFNFFNPNTATSLETWDNLSGALKNPLNVKEALIAISAIHNGRATGSDGIAGEYIKYGGEAMAQQVVSLVNNIFITKRLVPELCEGILIPLNKPGKPKLVSNVRPITLLNSIRKLISVMLLNRIYPDVEKYIPPSQCGFRRHRSSVEIAWTYSWLKAISGRYKRVFYIMGIDMSTAFDSILRDKLLFVLKRIVKEDEYRMIRLLLANTTLRVRVNGELGDPFETKIGTPQGDGLSPILFTIYLENAMREIRSTDIALYGKCNGNNWNTDIQELQYADDCDFICSDSNDSLNKLLENLTSSFIEMYNLKVNKGKTERKCIEGGATKLSDYKKLGSHLDPATDVKLRITKANLAFHTMWKTWKCKDLLCSTRIRLYNICILPILLYNISAVAYTELCIEKLEAAHRQHLRHILGVYYPKIISNADLFRKTNTTILRSKIIQARWNFFRKALLQNIDYPANNIIVNYFNNACVIPKGRGRQATSIATVLHADVQLVGKSLKNMKDVQSLQILNSTDWKVLVNNIIKETEIKVTAANVEKTRKRKQRNDEKKRCKELGIEFTKRRRRNAEEVQGEIIINAHENPENPITVPVEVMPNLQIQNVEQVEELIINNAEQIIPLLIEPTLEISKQTRKRKTHDLEEVDVRTAERNVKRNIDDEEIIQFQDGPDNK